MHQTAQCSYQFISERPSDKQSSSSSPGNKTDIIMGFLGRLTECCNLHSPPAQGLNRTWYPNSLTFVALLGQLVNRDYGRADEEKFTMFTLTYAFGYLLPAATWRMCSCLPDLSGVTVRKRHSWTSPAKISSVSMCLYTVEAALACCIFHCRLSLLWSSRDPRFQQDGQIAFTSAGVQQQENNSLQHPSPCGLIKFLLCHWLDP